MITTLKSLFSSSPFGAAVVVLPLFCSGSAFAAESRGYVVSWFHTATHSAPDNCPNGQNLGATGFYERELIRLGKSEDEARKTVTSSDPKVIFEMLETLRFRGRVIGMSCIPTDFATLARMFPPQDMQGSA